MASFNRSQSLIMSDRLLLVPEENAVGGDFEGDSRRDQEAGRKSSRSNVSFNIYQRNVRPVTYFMRVSLKSQGGERLFIQFNMDVNRYDSESDIEMQAYIAGGNLAIKDMENHFATWDPEEIGREAVEAARVFFKDLAQQ